LPSDPLSDPIILALDSSAAYCAAALVCGEKVLATGSETMDRGQAERLMPLLEEVLARGNVQWRDLAAIGVGVGPGNFTGIRIGVSAARGLALGLGCPAVGVTGFEARSIGAAASDLVAIPAPRDQVYLAGTPDNPDQPVLVPIADAQSIARDLGKTLRTQAEPADLALAIARIAQARWQTVADPPAPLYLRPADAAPSRDKPPVLLDP